MKKGSLKYNVPATCLDIVLEDLEADLEKVFSLVSVDLEADITD